MVDERLDDIVEDHARELFEFSPVTATMLGVGDHDHRLPTYTAESVRARCAALRRLGGRLRGLGPAELGPPQRIDAELTISRIDAELFDWEEMRPHERRVDLYLNDCFYGLYFLVTRDYLPAGERARAARARLGEVPRLLEEARKTVAEPPRIWVETGIQSAAAGCAFVDEVVAKLGEAEPREREALARAGGEARRAFEGFVAYLREDLLPRATGSHALGEDLFQRKLRDDHMVDYTLPELERVGREVLAETRERAQEVAREIDGHKSLAEVMVSLKQNHPLAEDLLHAYQEEVSRTRRFVEEARLAPIPAEESLVCVWTPEFERAIIPYAAYLPPGPFETRQQGHFYVTPVDPRAPRERQAETLHGHNWSSIPLVVLHEGYPGHHLQITHANLVKSKARRISWSPVFAEGWALYCEELMGEAGYYRSPGTRLAQLKDTLWRAVRVLVDLGLHTAGMTFDEAVDMLVGEAFLERANAQTEVRRYTAEPTYQSCYLMGKLEVKELARKLRVGEAGGPGLFSFHEMLLSTGSLPVRLLRRELLGGV